MQGYLDNQEAHTVYNFTNPGLRMGNIPSGYPDMDLKQNCVKVNIVLEFNYKYPLDKGATDSVYKVLCS